jgi:phosphoserine phosphatase RsbU/P
MELPFRNLRLRLSARGLLPRTRLGRAAWYLLVLDLLIYLGQNFLKAFGLPYAQSLGGWVSFLSFSVIVLFAILAFRWLREKLLWRLRNRLIVTYIFIGVIPAMLLIAMAFITIYLFAGQFANFVVMSELDSRLRSLAAVNAAISNELAPRVERGQSAITESLLGLKRNDPEWAVRQLCAWKDGKPLSLCESAGQKTSFSLPNLPAAKFTAIVSDQQKLYLRAALSLPAGSTKLTVVSSESLDRALLEKISANLGEITLYAEGFDNPPSDASRPNLPPAMASRDQQASENFSFRTDGSHAVVRSEQGEHRPVFIAGALPPSTGVLDRVITFGTPLPVTDWATLKEKKASALLRVQTRPSVLYARLFAALGDFAAGVESFLLAFAVALAIIELLALFIATRLTRTVTGAVAQLYDATKHINRGDFHHRIVVKSHDQIATLANSFNSMTESIEKLIEEQKAKQRLENELAIAQEVQAQLFPQQISQLASLEVHGFCRPARRVSGDYYDFLKIDSNKLMLAVGDVSGKGISAALLMATIHSAVRAYSLEGIPIFREPLAVGAGSSGGRRSSDWQGVEASPAALLSLLNHQLYKSTPAEKYATLFLGIYDGQERKLTYSNAGHLPPFIVDEDGATRRLDCGGTVVGLFDGMNYEEAHVQLRRGEILLAYSDGVTEPENDFGEFGEQRLLDLVRENRDLPLPRISQIVTAAVDDWIGANEQPDDVTLVLARTR